MPINLFSPQFREPERKIKNIQKAQNPDDKPKIHRMDFVPFARSFVFQLKLELRANKSSFPLCVLPLWFRLFGEWFAKNSHAIYVGKSLNFKDKSVGNK